MFRVNFCWVHKLLETVRGGCSFDLGAQSNRKGVLCIVQLEAVGRSLLESKVSLI